MPMPTEGHGPVERQPPPSRDVRDSWFSGFSFLSKLTVENCERAAQGRSGQAPCRRNYFDFACCHRGLGWQHMSPRIGRIAAVCRRVRSGAASSAAPLDPPVRPVLKHGPNTFDMRARVWVLKSGSALKRMLGKRALCDRPCP